MKKQHYSNLIQHGNLT